MVIRISRCRIGCLALFLLATLSPFAANASTLTAGDLFAAGDGLLTLDSATGLEWLDLTSTKNISPTAILGDAGGWIGLGFGLATSAQVSALFLNSAVGVTLTTTLVGPNFTGATNLLTLMGQTGGPPTSPRGVGWTADGPSPGNQYQPFYLTSSTPDEGTLTSPDGATTPSADLFVGNFLVRATAVPEPTTLLLLSMGLAGLVVSRKRNS